MSKPFKIINLENLEIELLEDLKKGTKINLKNYINDNELNDLLLSFKHTFDEKYFLEKIKEKENSLKNEYELQLKIKEQELNNNLNEQIRNKESEINKLKLEKQNIEENQKIIIEKESLLNKQTIEDKFKKIIEDIKNENNDLSNEIKKFKENQEILIENEKYKVKEELQNQISIINNKNKELEDENKRLKREKNSYSIKHAGTEFENWCEKELKNHFELMTNDTVILPAKYIKDEDTNEKTSSDLIVEIKPNSNHDKVYKIVLEMKTESLTTKQENKKTNEYHLKQLTKDVIKNNAEFGVLVTELEPEDNFIIKRPTHINGADNIYIIRPNMLVSFIQLLRLFFLKFAAFENYEIEFQKKEQIIKTWEDFKTTFNKTFELWRKNVQKIIDNANKIKELSDEILETIEGVSEKHIRTLEKKVNEFKIENKIIKKIEKLNE